MKDNKYNSEHEEHKIMFQKKKIKDQSKVLDEQAKRIAELMAKQDKDE